MHLLHISIAKLRYCALAAKAYLGFNKDEKNIVENEYNPIRKEPNMAFATDTRRAAAHHLSEDLSVAVYAAMQRITNYRAYRRTIRELSELSSHDLADLGLHRSEIRRVAHESVYGTRP